MVILAHTISSRPKNKKQKGEKTKMDYIERNRDFKGVWIPKEIWLNENLTMLEKVILTEIDSLDNDEHCVAGNDYLAQFCQCSIPKVTQAIKKLTELGYIEVVSFDGRHRRLRSCIIKNMSHKDYDAESGEVLGSIIKSIRQPNKKYEAASGKVLAINIDNNIDNNLFINNDGETSSPSVKETEIIEITEEQRLSEGEVVEPSTPPKEKPKKQSLKDQLTEYVQETRFTDETKAILLKWIFAVGLPRTVRLEQLRDKLKDIWEQCNGDENLVRTAINNAYLNNWCGFFPVNKPTPAPKTPAQPMQTPCTPPAKKQEAYKPSIEEMRAIANLDIKPDFSNIIH